MRVFLFVILLLLNMSAARAKNYVPGQSFLALCYHNVEDENPDQTFEGVTTGKLIEQLSWLKNEGYQAVSIDDLLAARNERKPLPPKAMLLTFDDGYESFYTRVYPILRTFHFPAVVGVVGEWMKNEGGTNARPGDKVHYGDRTMPRETFLTWPQVKEMQKSGLVEIASHSNTLHSGIPANPQGNLEPAAVTTAYDPTTHSYETPQAYEKRIVTDAQDSARIIEQETGRMPRTIIWPYGAGNRISIAAYEKQGMPISLSLDDGFGTIRQLRNASRLFVDKDPELGDFAITVRQLDRPLPIRVVQVDLDYVYDPDPAQQERNLDALVARIYALNINTVFLQAFADPDGTGLAREVYFPNRFLPMRADLLNRVAWQLRTRAKVKIYGWLPVLSFDFKAPHVTAWNEDTKKSEHDNKAYQRVSPFDAEARSKIIGIYEDMARQAPIDGILFHDDAMLSDFEDASPAAVESYKRAGLLPSIDRMRSDPKLMKKWTDFKTDTLINLTQDIAEHARLYRAPLKTARNIYAPVVLDPASETWFAQNYDKFLKAYDYTAIEAMPRMENIPEDETDDWLQRLVAAAAKRADGLTHTIFELQTVDWRKADDADRAIPTDEITHQMRLLTRNGAMNFGYYPDDFVTNTPDADALHPAFSLQTYPYTP